MFYFENVQLDELVVNAELVIFDMNGLIVDDEKLQLEAVNMTLEPYKIKISEDKWIADFVGHKAIEIFDMIMNKNKIKLKKLKPDPEIYLTVSRKLHVESKDCVVFEDTSIGVESAVCAGMRCIAVPNKYTQEQNFEGAYFVVDNLTPKAQISGL